ncbi:acetate kinase [Lysobacter sp. A6]|uniref:Acetate kinase n=1 Tax=Noviluteimonas lactosilytica TaxID=2888523 RepID=A0ABS8JL69_9GAMM|nr:acetate kinase [Lysobacter lactosilyticus]MCC8364352.1 acetate kinase [Lysobacter lactosilyticus]
MRLRPALALALAAIATGAHAQQQVAKDGDDARIERLEAQLQAQSQRLDALEKTLVERDFEIAELRQEIGLDDMRGRGTAQGKPQAQTPRAPATAQAQPSSQSQNPTQSQTPASPQQPVGQAPDVPEQPPQVAQIFDQPSVLTPAGSFVFEPSLQVGYWANDRVALVGYSVIPALLIGLIDVRQVKITSTTAALAARWGVAKGFELEARIPYVYTTTDTVSREIFTGTAVDRVFEAEGKGLGDVELTARYQFSRSGPDRPFYVGWLRYKSTTGEDPFEVPTDCITRCLGNATGTGLPLELPTGTGFDALQAGVTWLYASDPAVFFGNFSYLYSFPRDNVERLLVGGEREPLGEIDVGDVFGLNVGIGLALNEKASISLGYEQNFIGRTQQNGQDLPGAVRLVTGTLLLGASYRFSDTRMINVSLGVGTTRDTPDVTLTVRTPFSVR